MTPYVILSTSPQRADPLTWVLSFNVPIVAALVSGIGGIVLAALLSVQGVAAPAVLIATALSVLGSVLVLHQVRPQRPYFRPTQALAPLACGLASMVASAVAHRGSDIDVEQWTGPLGLCTVLAALVPYCSAFTISALGITGGVASAIAAQWTFPNPDAGALSMLVAGAAWPLHIGVVGATFSAMVVAAVTRWRALPYDREESVDRPATFTERLREHGTPIAISDEVIALLTRVADGGRVTAKDRTDAAVLAADIRADLVAVMNRSWLETIPQHKRLVVEDPDGVANHMTREQRAAIHSLIVATLNSPVMGEEALTIDLRQLDDGTTAVALSMNIELPEGRRVMMLAPYFVTLKASVEDFEWAGGEQLRMRFKLPPPGNPSV